MSHTTTLPNSGAVVPTTGAPDYGGGATDFALVCLALGTLDSQRGNNQVLTAAGAVAIKSGKVFLKAGAGATFTLVVPTAGAPSAGGQDATDLEFINVDGYAYKIHITTAASYWNGGADAFADIAAAIGNGFHAVAYNGEWYTSGALTGTTLGTS